MMYGSPLSSFWDPETEKLFLTDVLGTKQNKGFCDSVGAEADAGGCRRVGSSRFPLVHDVSDRLSLPLCYQELLGKALDGIAEDAGQ